jgi:hypothetical protein
MAALTVSVLYLGAAGMRLTVSDPPFSWPALSVSIASHLAVFTLVFVALQWISVAANRFSNPGLAQFALRAIVSWILLAVLVRKIIFALLSFNDYLANLYAGLFSFTLVAFIAAMVLKIKEQHALMDRASFSSASVRKQWIGPLLVLIAAISLFYVFAIKFAAVDWEHVLSCVLALVIAGLILCFFLAVRHRQSNYRTSFMALISILSVVPLAVFQATRTC